MVESEIVKIRRTCILGVHESQTFSDKPKGNMI